MGIKDLLQSVGDAMDDNFALCKLAGKRVAIDASSWLHKAIFATAAECLDLNFEEHLLYVDFIVTRTRNFRLCGVEPVLVFDGKRHHMKSDTNRKRSEERLSNLEQGHRLMDSMKKTTDRDCLAKLRTEAIACLQKGLSVTADVERHTIAAMRRLGITVIVAPYEADAQLAYLCHIGACDAVMTEDSDLILYSVISGRNFPILYKFNTSGSSHYFESNRMFEVDTTDEFGAEATGRRSKFLPGLRDFRGASGRRMFVQMCVLAGCDYNDSVHGVGLQTAQQAVLKYKEVNDNFRLEAILKNWAAAGKSVPPGYLERVLDAELFFFYHPVYDPSSKSLVYFAQHIDLPKEVQEVLPPLHESKIANIGSEIDVLSKMPADSVVTLEDVCEGVVSRFDFTPIKPALPWEHPSISALIERIPLHSQGSSAWSLRRNLSNILRDSSQVGFRSASQSASIAASAQNGLRRVRSVPASSLSLGPSAVAPGVPGRRPAMLDSRPTPPAPSMLKSSKKTLDSKTFYESRMSTSTTVVAAVESSSAVNAFVAPPPVTTVSPRGCEEPPVFEQRSRSRTLEEHELVAIVSNITAEIASQDSIASTAQTELMSQSSFVSDDSDSSDDDEEDGSKPRKEEIAANTGNNEVDEARRLDEIGAHISSKISEEIEVTVIEQTHVEEVGNLNVAGFDEDDELEMESIEILMEDSAVAVSCCSSSESLVEGDDFYASREVDNAANTDTSAVLEVSSSSAIVVTTPVNHHSSASRGYQEQVPEISPSDKTDCTVDLSNTPGRDGPPSERIGEPEGSNNEDRSRLKRKIDENESDNFPHGSVSVPNNTRGIAPIKLQSVLINADPNPSKRKKVVKTMAVASIKSFFAVKQ